MRFLVHEKGYEHLLMRGAYRYAHPDEPTGAIESWRLTETPDGDRILRIDLDGRASSGTSTLYHVIMTARFVPLRVTYRQLTADGGRVTGNLLNTLNTLTNSRHCDGVPYAEEQPLQPLLIPSVAGIGWLARQFAGAPLPETAAFAMFNTGDDGAAADRMRLIVRQGGWTAAGEPRTVAVGPTPHGTTAVTLAWDDQTRTVWRDDVHGWPLMMERGDGLRAIATHVMVG